MNKICAVVVTHNRRELLLRCLTALYKQTVPLDGIIVVDNFSTDGSRNFIFSNLFSSTNQDEDKTKLHWFRTEENLGGAGGFQKGTELAMYGNYDYLWLMDDDGFPVTDTLERLIPFATQLSFVCPLVISDDDSTSLAFPLRLPGSLEVLETTLDVNRLNADQIYGMVAPFNGTLISAPLIRKIGYPNGNFFIWGDEIDYAERAKKVTKEVKTVTCAKFFHPKGKNVGTPMFFNILRFNEPQSEIKLFCYSRNNFYNIKKYRGRTKAILFAIKVIWYFTFTNPKIDRLIVGLKGLIAGINGDFSGHKKYL